MAILSPTYILSLCDREEAFFNVSAAGHREFLLHEPAAVRSLLHGQAGQARRPSKIFYWKQLVAKTADEDIPLALRALKTPASSVGKEQGRALPLMEGEGLLSLNERQLNLAVLDILLADYPVAVSQGAKEDFLTACDGVEAYKTAVKEQVQPGLGAQLLFRQAVEVQRQFALEIYKNVCRQLPPVTGDPELYLSEKEEVDSLIGILHFACKNISNAIGWTLFCLAAAPGEPARYQDKEGVYHAVLEALRLYPPNWLFHRVATGPLELGGLKCVEGDVLHVSPLLLHRSHKFWHHAGSYRPERFLQGEPLNPWCFIPFGRSVTKCPGTQVSLAIIRQMVSRIAESYRVIRTEERPPLWTNTISLNPFPLPGVCFQERQPLCV